MEAVGHGGEVSLEFRQEPRGTSVVSAYYRTLEMLKSNLDMHGTPLG